MVALLWFAFRMCILSQLLPYGLPYRHSNPLCCKQRSSHHHLSEKKKELLNLLDKTEAYNYFVLVWAQNQTLRPLHGVDFILLVWRYALVGKMIIQ